MKRLNADVAIIGAGGAGMMAALEASEQGADVLIVGKAGMGKGTCTSYAGGFFTSSSQEFTIEQHNAATWEVGRHINDAQLVDLITQRAAECLERLRDMGVGLLPMGNGYRVDNHGNEKLIPGYPLVNAMRRAMDARGVRSLTGFHALELITQDDAVAGILGVTAEGPAVISAPSVILATGGAGAIYLRNDNPMGITGDGYAIALKAGCLLRDMEFVQFYPIGIAEPGMAPNLILPPFPSEAKVYDAQNRNAFDDLENCNSIADAISRFRDTASIFFYRKHLEGGLFLDLTGVDDSKWKKFHSLQLLAKKKFDFRTQKLGIAPIAHFFIGGVEINTDMESTLPGLFAIGEVTGGFHGANRMGGNALTECIVSGTVAGANAASLSKSKGAVDGSGSGVTDRIPNWAMEKGQGVRPEYGNLFNRIKKTAWENAGIIRDLEGMQEGLEQVSVMEDELKALTPGNITEGLRANRMHSALLTLRCILKASLMRKESRGALYREDYPEANDADWRRNIFISLDRSTGDLVLEDRAID
jgi:succinate dehydrogenase/fumarate reductase flavoprotein subunit